MLYNEIYVNFIKWRFSMKRSIKIRLGFVFLLIFVPFLVMMVNSFITFNTLSDDGKSINLSGSQRMRTMLLSNYSQQLYYARQANNDEESTSLEKLLTKEVNTYNENMTTLISGDSSKGIKENKTQSIVDAINTITPDVTSYSTAVSDLISGNKEKKENLDYIITQSLNIKKMKLTLLLGCIKSATIIKSNPLKTCYSFY